MLFSDPQGSVTVVADVGVAFKVIAALKSDNTAVTVADAAGADAKTTASVGELLLFAGTLVTSNTCKLYYFTHYLSTNMSNSNKH